LLILCRPAECRCCAKKTANEVGIANLWRAVYVIPCCPSHTSTTCCSCYWYLCRPKLDCRSNSTKLFKSTRFTAFRQFAARKRYAYVRTETLLLTLSGNK